MWLKGIRFTLLIPSALTAGWCGAAPVQTLSGGRTAEMAATDLSSPQRAMDEFFTALNSFDAGRYKATLAENATLFFTGPPFPIRRVQGRTEIMRLVTPLFDTARARGTKGTVRPEDIEFQTWGDTSVVTFHISVGSGLDRRTFVLRRQYGRWRIEHLHASLAVSAPVHGG